MKEITQDFRNFLYLAWRPLSLPSPTPVQFDIADFLQNAPRRTVIQAFRGVGKSDGEHDGSEGELADSAIALDWLQSQNHESDNFWICGISFGAWVGMQLLMRRPEIPKFILISPPAGKYDFNFLAPCPASGLVISGEKDSLIDTESVRGIIKKLNQQKSITVKHEVVKSSDHFFNEMEQKVLEKVKKYVSSS